MPAAAQNEQFIPILSYRTGAYAVNGVPYANGVVDYYNLVNERDGGINGVKLTFEECETGYATDKGVECYERLKGKGPTGASYVNPLSTGITFALTEKGPVDKIPIITMGYGRANSKNGAVFTWNFPLLGTYWSAADIAIQHIAKEMGGFDKLKGKKISLVLSRQPLRQGADPGAAGAGAEARLRVHAHPRHASGRRAEVAVADHPPEPARLRAALGLGRHERRSHQGSSRRRLSSRQDARRVVVGCRARRDARRRPVGRLQGADAAARRPEGPRARRYREARLRQGQGHHREGEDRRGALQPRRRQRHARRRGDPHGAEEVRQQAADRRAGALGLREPQPLRPTASRRWASRAC